MKSLKFVIVGSRITGKGWDAQENITSFSIELGEVKKFTQGITELLKEIYQQVRAQKLSHCALYIKADNGKSIEVKYSTDLLKFSTDVFLSLPYLDVFEQGHRKIDAATKSSNPILINIASSFKLKRNEISLNEYLSAIEIKVKVIRETIFIENRSVSDEILSDGERKILSFALAIRKDDREQAKKLLEAAKAEIKAA